MSADDVREAVPARSGRGRTAALFTVLCYCGVLVPGGHGAAPVALVLLWAPVGLLGPSAEMGDPDLMWHSRMMVSGAVAGWAGALVLVAAQVIAGRVRVAGTLAGLSLLLVSLFVLLAISDAAGFGIVTALPFGAAATWLVLKTSAPAR